MLNRFLAWWARQLAEFVPVGWRGAESGGAATVISLSSTDTPKLQAVIAVRSRRAQEVLCTGSLDESGMGALGAALARRRRPSRTVLRLPRATLLQREVVLPLAAEWDPLAVIGNDLDRLTPFRREELVWTAETVARDRDRGRLVLSLSFIPRALMANALAQLARLGLRPEEIEVALPGAGDAPENRDSGTLLRLALDGHEDRNRKYRRRLKWALCTVGALAIAAIVVPFVRQSLVARALSDRIAALGPSVSEVLALRGRIGSAAEGADAIHALRVASGDPLQALAALTRTLPDDTWLESVTFSHRQLAITGRSLKAARLIGLIAADSSFRNPAFTAPVIRAPEGGDEFTIHAEWAQ